MYIPLLVLFCTVVGLLFFVACIKRRGALKKGDKAPDFTLQDEAGLWHTLQEFRGKNVVLYFYPHDDTPGCTRQACSFRDMRSLYAQHAIVVVGINFDSPESHAAFKQKYHLPFILLSDSTGETTKAYGATRKIPFAKNIFPQRVTFLIDTQGTIIKVLQGIDVSTYADTVLKEFALHAQNI